MINIKHGNERERNSVTEVPSKFKSKGRKERLDAFRISFPKGKRNEKEDRKAKKFKRFNFEGLAVTFLGLWPRKGKRISCLLRMKERTSVLVICG